MSNLSDKKFKKVDNYIFSTSDILGKGAFGQVVKGIQTDTREEVAVKIVNLTNAVNQQSFVKNLNREISILLNVRHQHIVKLFRITQTSNNIYMFLELCNGGDLRQIVQKKGGRLAESEAIVYFRQICSGFKELHRLGIIHRDIKPANILINNGLAKIADFGFARTLDCTQLNSVAKMTYLGTPLYMSPQILERGTFSSKCDIWSLGMVLYECLFGETPWNGNCENNLFQHIQSQKLTFPSSISCSELTKDLLQRMLTVEDTQRISWEEMFLHPVVSESAVSQLHLLQPEGSATDLPKAGENCSLYFASAKIAGVEKSSQISFKPINPSPKSQFEVQKSLQDFQAAGMVIEEAEEIKSSETISRRVDAGMTYYRNINALFGYLTSLVFDLYRRKELQISRNLFLRISFVFLKFFLIRAKRLEQLLQDNKSPQAVFSSEDWVIYTQARYRQETLNLVLKDVSFAEPYMLELLRSLSQSQNEGETNNNEMQGNSQLNIILNQDYVFNGVFISVFKDTILEFIDSIVKGFDNQCYQSKKMVLYLLKMCLVSLDADQNFKMDEHDIGQDQFSQFYSKYEHMPENDLQNEVKAQLQSIFSAVNQQ